MEFTESMCAVSTLAGCASKVVSALPTLSRSVADEDVVWPWPPCCCAATGLARAAVMSAARLSAKVRLDII